MGAGQSILEASEAITSRGLQVLRKHLICALKTVSAWCGGRAEGQAEHSSYLAEDVSGMSRIRLKGTASTLLPHPPYRHRLTSM